MAKLMEQGLHLVVAEQILPILKVTREVEDQGDQRLLVAPICQLAPACESEVSSIAKLARPVSSRHTVIRLHLDDMECVMSQGIKGCVNLTCDIGLESRGARQARQLLGVSQIEVNMLNVSVTRGEESMCPTLCGRANLE